MDAQRSDSARSRRAAVGRAGEEAAAAYLAEAGLVVERRNWRCRSGELDMIARDGETLVFVEVRSRTSPSRFGSAIEAVTPRKCRQVRELAAIYLRTRGASANSARFDVVAVTFREDGSVADIRHIRNAF
ncbi:YraN family protein [Cohnella hongkongensis]|uniref:UPF0102 protein ACFO3S_11745 n=1 Tax=Cohnella hongkongensis TaxID=178337 RepID=A0ABV9FD04_9BACL